MAGVEGIVTAVLTYGVGSAFGVVLALLLWRAGRILVDHYTKPVAETVWLTLSNWLVAIMAVVLARWVPGLADTLDEQLDWLECYQDDGITGLRLLRHAAAFAVRMRTTAIDKDHVAPQRVADADHEALNLPRYVSGSYTRGTAKVVLEDVQVVANMNVYIDESVTSDVIRRIRRQQMGDADTE